MTSSEPAAQDDTSSVPRARSLDALVSTGRYQLLTKPDGGNVHILAVVPGAQLSADEVKLLTDKIQPDAIYIDMIPEELNDLKTEMKLSVDGRPQMPGADWESFKFRWDRGWAASFTEHTQRAPRQLAQLAGIDYFAAQREALRYATKHASTQVVAYPFTFSKKYEDAFEPFRRVVGLELDLEGEQGAYMNSTKNTLYLRVYPTMATQLATVPLELPPSEHYNTDQLADIRKTCRGIMDKAAADITIDSVDGAAGLIVALKEMYGDDFNPASPPDLASQVLVNSLEFHQKQAQAAAYAVQTTPGDNIVALIDAARVSSYVREWEQAATPSSVFPDRTQFTAASKWAFIGSTSLLFGWGFVRSVRRFPKSIAALTLAGGVYGGAQYWESFNQPKMMCGNKVRGALAKPVMPIGANLRR